jgi:hypothetical protein
VALGELLEARIVNRQCRDDKVDRRDLGLAPADILDDDVAVKVSLTSISVMIPNPFFFRATVFSRQRR